MIPTHHVPHFHAVFASLFRHTELSDSYLAVGSRGRIDDHQFTSFMADMSSLWHLHHRLCINTTIPFL
jgi:hypothetical protein